MSLEETLPDVGRPAPDATLRDTADQPIQLSALWREQPVVLVFIRHFG
ncbi:redoxin domain-containing protein [Kallotenue papyrolyticum]